MVAMLAVEQLRLLIADTDPARQVLTDEQVLGFLSLYVDDQREATRADVKRAAADALDAIATSEALVSKVIRSQDISTDGAKVAAELRKHAQSLRTQADVDDDRADGGFVEVVEFTPWPRSWGW